MTLLGRLAMLVVATLLIDLAASSCNPLAGSTQTVSRTVTPSQMRVIATQLPPDPSEAAAALVDRVIGADTTSAEAATAELLRRSGFPIVSIKGPIIGMPDDVTLIDSPVYVEMIPDLTRAVRKGDFYSPAQVTELLAGIGLSNDPLPPDVLVTALGEWGKAADSPAEFHAAATAVRSLSGGRGDVLYSGADVTAVQLDPLQTLIIVGYMSSRFEHRPPAKVASPKPTSALDKLLGIQVAWADDGTSGPCTKAAEDLEHMKKTYDGQGQVGDAIIDKWKDNLITDIAGKLPHAVGKGIETGALVYDKGADVVAVMLLLMGAQIEVDDNHGHKTHFRHKAGDTSRDVKFTAVASFSSNIANEHIDCYKLAGMDVPPSGKLSGFRVRWTLNQLQQTYARGTFHNIVREDGKYLKTPGNERYKTDSCGSCGQITGSDGKSTLDTYPATELHPPPDNSKAAVSHGKATITASLDKDDFPLKLSHFLDPNALKVLWVNTLDLALGAVKRAGLPSAKDTVTVDYHGSDIYVAKGDTPTVFLFFINMPVFMDIYTCDGLDGHWKGSAGANVDPTFFGQIAAQIAKSDLPPASYRNDNLSFQITPEQQAFSNPFTINSFMQGNITITDLPKPDDHYNGVVGSVDFVINGQFLNKLGQLEGGIFTTKYDVVGLPEDDRCPKNGSYFENYG